MRRLALTAEGRSLLAALVPAMQSAQQRMLVPLPKAERGEFMRMLHLLVTSNNELGRAPSAMAPD